MYDERKLVGSAQRRFEDALLQHGSIILGDAHLKLVEYLAATRNGRGQEAADALRQKTVSLEEILSRAVTYAEVAAGLRRGFETVFEAELNPTPLSGEENKVINELRNRYLDIQ